MKTLKCFALMMVVLPAGYGANAASQKDKPAAAAATSFRFVSWADTKTATQVLSDLSDQVTVLSPAPAFTIYPGDLENSGFTQTGMDAWRTAINGQLTGSTVSNGLFEKTFPVRGNHDASNTTGWQAYYTLGTVAGLVGATNYEFMTGAEDLVYAFDYGNARFIGLDVLGDAQTLAAAQIAWMDGQLASAEARGLTHAFIYFHGPIYCVDGHCSCAADDRTCAGQGATQTFIDVINKHPIVAATFHGHEHVYAYTYLDNTRIPGLTHPFPQLITGDAGAGTSACMAGRVDYCMSNHGFVTVDVNGTSVTFTWYKQGSSQPQNTVTIEHGSVTPPAAPANLIASGGDAVVGLSWSASSGATGYNVLRSLTSGSGYSGIAANVTAASYDDTTVSNGTTYYYVVQAANSAGSSGYSNEASATPACAVPPAPAALTAAAGNAQVLLSWSGSSGAASYSVKRSNASGGPYAAIQAGVTGTSYTDTAVVNGTTYYYIVSALNSCGESANSGQASATPVMSAPASPTSLTAAAVSATQVSLAWTDNASNEAGFRIERCMGSGCTGFIQIAEVGANITSYSDTGLAASTRYSYRVRAYNTGGPSAYSNIASVRTKRAPKVGRTEPRGASR